jgi:hemerythrin-like metal-binding protein
MLNFEWKKEFNIGNELIDSHHKRIIGLTNKLYDAVKYDNEIFAVTDILESLTKYAQTHFTAEEQLFLPTAHPDSKKHIALHQEFCVKLIQLKALLQQHDTSAGMELMEFLTAWFINHILQIDRQYIPYLRTTPSSSAPPAANTPPD